MFLRLTNTPREYAWGSRTAIAEALGTTPTGKPEAELWLGTHPANPSSIVDGSAGGTTDLRQFLDAHPLPSGQTELPFLLKLLAAAQPLSLQAHPSKAQAVAGFAREEAAEVARDAPHRNYKDENHKPELIVAVSDRFEALSGFRPVAESLSSLRALRDAGSTAGLDVDALIEFLAELESFTSESDALAWVLEWLLNDKQAHAVAIGVVRAAEIPDARLDEKDRDTIGRINAVYGADPGVVLALFLHRVSLNRGEALYLPAGNLHAYLYGLGVELMAASDNVLRGGLTPKHIDVEELLNVVKTEALPAPLLEPVTVSKGVRLFRPDVPDFELWHISSADFAEVELPGPSILLNLGESAQLVGALSEMTLSRGDSVYIPAEELPLSVSGEDIYIASGGSPRAAV